MLIADASLALFLILNQPKNTLLIKPNFLVVGSYCANALSCEIVQVIVDFL
jgi:hypothetical protein